MQQIELSPEQRARLPEFIEKWTRIALSTRQVDRRRAGEALARLYRAAGLAAPYVVWLPCPMSAILSAIAYARVKARRREREMRDRRARGDFVEALSRQLLLVNYDADRPIERAIEQALVLALRQRPNSELGFDYGKTAAAIRRVARGVFLPGSLDWTLLTELIMPLDRAVGTVLRLTWHTVEIIEHRAQDRGDRLVRSIAGASFGSKQIGDAARLDYANSVFELPIDRSYLGTLESCGAYWTLDGICFAAERPLSLKRDKAGRLHSETGPSLAYRSGWRWWHWHGLQVARYVVEDPAKISIATIDGVRSPELRRILIERYRYGEAVRGAVAFLCDGGATRLHHDPALGTLWRRDLARDEPIVMVEVPNRSAEPDGSFKRYFLRVDPRLRPILADGGLGEPQPPTVRNAIASTFGLCGAEYMPEVET